VETIRSQALSGRRSCFWQVPIECYEALWEVKRQVQQKRCGCLSECIRAYILVPIADQEQYGIGFIRRATHDSTVGFHLVLEDVTRYVQNEPVEATVWEKTSYHNMMITQRSRRPFLSTKGFVGIAPDHAQGGGIIVIFLGGKFPYLLRENGDGTHVFIGEAYVRGIMYGEFMGKDADILEFLLQ
jgi:hypothetical protein